MIHQIKPATAFPVESVVLAPVVPAPHVEACPVESVELNVLITEIT